MSPESEFYQISGFQAHSNGWFKKYDDKPMIKAIMESKLFRPRGKDSPAELILGILPSGASYLLMTREQMYQFTHEHRLRTEREREPWGANEFLSLSPIYFNDIDELSAKTATYKQRPRNKNRREHETPKDNSQANRGYVQMKPDVVHYRAYFEQQRTLCRLLTRDLEPGKVALAPPPWLGGVRVVSLVFEEWAVEDRRRDVRLNDPRLVGTGWTDALLPSFFEELAGATVHLKLISSLNNPGSKKNAYFSKVIEEDQAGLYQHLRDLLNHDANQSGIPLIVLVHDEDMARSILSHAGIDLGSWSSGLSNLLPIAPPVKNRRKVEEDTSSSAVLPGPSIVDMQKLVRAVMETTPGHTIPHSAKVLRMQTDTRTCAGDDSLLLLRMWTSMAQGLAIDEQHKQRLSHEPECAQVLAPPQALASADDDPNDADPNDMPPGPRPTAADDFSSDEDW